MVDDRGDPLLADRQRSTRPLSLPYVASVSTAGWPSGTAVGVATEAREGEGLPLPEWRVANGQAAGQQHGQREPGAAADPSRLGPAADGAAALPLAGRDHALQGTRSGRRSRRSVGGRRPLLAWHDAGRPARKFKVPRWVQLVGLPLVVVGLWELISAVDHACSSSWSPP